MSNKDLINGLMVGIEQDISGLKRDLGYMKGRFNLLTKALEVETNDHSKPKGEKMPNIKMELEPISVPNYITIKSKPGKRQDGFKEGPKVHISDLDEFTLLGLASEFKSNLLMKAKEKK